MNEDKCANCGAVLDVRSAPLIPYVVVKCHTCRFSVDGSFRLTTIAKFNAKVKSFVQQRSKLLGDREPIFPLGSEN